MSLGNYSNGVTTVGTSATLICSVDPESDGVLVANTGSATVFVGGADVTASGANQGIPLAQTTTLLVPSIGGLQHQLYGVVAVSTQTVAWLYPQAS